MMKSHAKKAKTGAVIGGGLLGLEAAKAMLDLGVSDTHVIEFAQRLMPRQIDDLGSNILRTKLEPLGLKIHTSKNTLEILGDDTISGMLFSDETHINVDMLVISAGIKPRDELAKLNGLEVGPRGGIVVNDHMKTNDPYIFAIGECALYKGMIYGLVAPGYEMADVVATNLTGGDKSFTGYDMSTKLKLIGVDVASFGDPFISNDDCRSVVFQDTVKGIYKRINVSKDGKYLLGGILVGEAEEYNMLLQTTKNKVVLPPHPEDVILRSRGGSENGGAAGAGVLSLPDEATICSCEGISKGNICEQVLDGAETVEAIKKCTKAGTGCGGCVPMIKDLVLSTLKKEGKYIRNVLCEHFNYSRQEIFDLAKIKKLKTFDSVIDEMGQGHGCEVCKPAIASILASLWNDMVLNKGIDHAQDSNDRYLANIQKGGTYSVMPRVAGGEITPDALMLIGRVAKKYGLYTKITGGQRIDMFGAHVTDLPDIWQELIEGGMESGHAYGKALRTVKSCVGSTWCRFGLHDSVGFAIQIENRYKGLRAPHKIKSGVSGCIRECAEALNKDFGLIATEKGWNLFVCGNGGSKPQHSVLLANDINEETVIKYLDRFLMFYIRTAEPLMRTATWLNKMEGGIDYLKNVIINDSLGIGKELEQDMARFLASYRCEWKEVVDNPELRKRFTHFVNAPEEKDPTVKFDIVRGQKKAADWK
jgi:nitrite reductase (NADH) large subunit